MLQFPEPSRRFAFSTTSLQDTLAGKTQTHSNKSFEHLPDQSSAAGISSTYSKYTLFIQYCQHKAHTGKNRFTICVQK
jgi:hypothetical protein